MTNSNKLADALRDIVEMLREHPAMQGREYVGLGIAANNALREYDAALAEHDAQPAQGEWVMVPRVPPIGMLEALSMSMYSDIRLQSQRERFRQAYAAMLAAAPQPAPAPTSEERKQQLYALERCIRGRESDADRMDKQIDDPWGSLGYREDTAQLVTLHAQLSQPAPAPVQVDERIVVADLAAKLGVKIVVVIKALYGEGIFVSANQEIDQPTADLATKIIAAHSPAPAADDLEQAELWVANHCHEPAMEKILFAAIAALRQPVPDAVWELPGKYDSVLRPFFRLMERELHANAGKGDRPGWLAMSPAAAMLEIYYHAAKLQKAVKNGEGDAISEYAADVANMAMMMVDICGGLELESALAASAEGKTWRCEQCGELSNDMDPAWRWTGDRWQHHHEAVGHVDARAFGAEGKAVDLEQFRGAVEFWRDHAKVDHAHGVVTRADRLLALIGSQQESRNA